MAKKLTATHGKILDLLNWKEGSKKHINYVCKCAGYDYTKGIGEVYRHLLDLKNRRLVVMDFQLIDRPEDTYWQITDKGKEFLQNQ
ncbi:hypothetical protein HCU40_16720 [Pseudanabaena biceps]|nr:hypothetical protein [Pseudanabaena biceps]